MLYSEGEVVRAYYYWFDPITKKKGGIIRPVIIKEIKDNNYIIVKITRTPKPEFLRIKVNSGEWKKMGLYDYNHDSYIDRNAVQLITEGEIERLIGSCPQSIFEWLFENTNP